MELFEEIRKAHDRAELHPGAREPARCPSKSDGPGTPFADPTVAKGGRVSSEGPRFLEGDDRPDARGGRVGAVLTIDDGGRYT